MNSMIAASNTLYYKERINSTDVSQNSLSACVNESLHEIKTFKLPEYTSAEELSKCRATCFKDKIVTNAPAWKRLKRITTLTLDQLVPVESNLIFLDKATEEEVRTIIMPSASTSYCLPTHIPKKCLHLHICTCPAASHYQNHKPVIPHCFKIATVIPLLKKMLPTQKN